MAEARHQHSHPKERVSTQHHHSHSHHQQAHNQATQALRDPSLSQASAAGPSSSSRPQLQLHVSEDSQLPQWETIETTPPGSTARKPRTKPATDRTPGSTLIPTSRVESIVTADGENGTLSKEAIYALTVATEEFIKRLTYTAYVRADVDKRAITGYADVAESVEKFPEFRFLKDTIPVSMPLKQALATRSTIEQQREAYLDQVAEDAAVPKDGEDLEHRGKVIPYPGEDASASTSASNAKGKGKARASNTNGSISTGKSRSTKTRASSSAHPGTSSNANGTGDVSMGPPPTPSTPSLRSERLKNKRAKMVAEQVEASEIMGAPKAEFISFPDNIAGGPVSVNNQNNTTDSGPMSTGGDGMSISSAASAKSKPKSLKTTAAAINTEDARPNIVPMTTGASTSTGYKIKIRPRQSSSQAIPLANSSSSGVESVSNSLAGTTLQIPHQNDTNGLAPPAAKRPRLSLNTSSSSMPSVPANRETNGTNGSVSARDANHKVSTKSSAGGKKSKGSAKSMSKKSAGKGAAAANADGHDPSSGPVFAPVGAVDQPLWTRVPLSHPPSVSATAGNAKVSPTNGVGGVLGGGMGLDYRSALSPSATNPGRTIYSHSP